MNKLNTLKEAKANGKRQRLSIYEFLGGYEQSLSKRFTRRASILMYQCPIKEIMKFNKDINRPEDLTADILIEFQRYLYNERDFTFETVRSYILRIKLFYDYLISIKAAVRNPALDIDILAKPQGPIELSSRYYSLDELLRRYINHQRSWVSYAYLIQIEKHLKGFFSYLKAIEHNTIYKVSQAVVIKYREYLFSEYIEAKEGDLVPKSQRERLRCICRFFRYLHREGIIREDPAKDLGWESYYKNIFKEAKNIPKPKEQDKRLSSLDELKEKFLEYEKTKGKAKSTLTAYRKGIEIFFDFLRLKNISNIALVDKRLLLDYYPYLHNYKSIRDKEVSTGCKARYLWSIKVFFRFLVRFDYLSKDPAMDLEPIKEERGLPHSCMNEREILRLLDMPKPSSPLGKRDKAIMEVLFSTGIRVNELCHLNIEDTDYAQGIIRINKAKGGGNYQRVIPIGSVALDFLSVYLREARPLLENGDSKAIFLSYSGKRINTEAVLNLVKKYAFEAGIRKHITPHSFRVTCATSMLKNGADIRYVQEQLGHKKITSTQIYTRLMPFDLKAIHKKCHPRERKIENSFSPLQPISASGKIEKTYSEITKNFAVGM